MMPTIDYYQPPATDHAFLQDKAPELLQQSVPRRVDMVLGTITFFRCSASAPSSTLRAHINSSTPFSALFLPDAATMFQKSTMLLSAKSSPFLLTPALRLTTNSSWISNPSGP
ncbi:hypothetical protein L596_001002 [Steinernema carpocapsae]|uniref:Uncharacterized protein n=1 Tax=Steinernema carpocapsae TaxID=34508 RepID=A0A4U8UJQ7_STECR|nr:hypothetical protein L596_001002 [Steinernema carpocapsae]